MCDGLVLVLAALVWVWLCRMSCGSGWFCNFPLASGFGFPSHASVGRLCVCVCMCFGVGLVLVLACLVWVWQKQLRFTFVFQFPFNKWCWFGLGVGFDEGGGSS